MPRSALPIFRAMSAWLRLTTCALFLYFILSLAIMLLFAIAFIVAIAEDSGLGSADPNVITAPVPQT